MISALVTALTAALFVGLAPAPQADHFSRNFAAEDAGEAFTTVLAGCARCDWGEPGREAAVLRVSVDNRYSQHIVLVRGEAVAEYHIALGPVIRGTHRLTIDRDAKLSARGAGPATIDVSDVRVMQAGSLESAALNMAPIIYARPNTVGTFTDVPLLMWYETVETPHGYQLRYSVIFSNEDGGTQTDRLMATWGRTTDIELVYGVEIDKAMITTLAEEFQGPGHEVPAFKGRHEGRHPLLWVSTDNNMVSERGPTRIRYAPLPVAFDLTDEAREAVMDANPWTYAIAAAEMRREGKIANDPPAGIDKIADPRRFVFVEACGTIGNAALSVSVGSRQSSVASRQSQSADTLTWTPSDRGMPHYRIVRDGCFTIATPLPAGTRGPDIRSIRVQAFERPRAEGAPPDPANPVTLTRINRVFMLDERYLPGPSTLHWEGSQILRAGGDPFEVRIP